MESFIEKQFPVSRVSKESYKERKAVQSQTLPRLGKWWGRKPLILVRAAILGCLMPASDNPKKDMEIFLKLLSMDDRELMRRKEKAYSVKEMFDLCQANPKLKAQTAKWFIDNNGKPMLRDGYEKAQVEAKIFKSLSYDQKISGCIRPEQLENLSEDSWREINEHLHINAHNMNELVEQLSQLRFGHTVRVGDCFCGGGSVPFEAARIGCDIYASDLNPVAGLLTWADIFLCGASPEEQKELLDYQKRVFEETDRQICELGIEHNELGDRAVSYIYCTEAKCPECGTRVPMASGWVIGQGSKTVAKLHPNGDHYDIEIKMNASPEEMKQAAASGTVKSTGLVCPHCGKSTPISILRGDRTDNVGNTVYGLRKWKKNEFDFQPEDILSERLYAIRYETKEGKRYYRAPNERDAKNERIIRELIASHIDNWQKEGYLPSSIIENGDKTKEVVYTRGWQFWHQLFNPRQLLTNSLILQNALKLSQTQKESALGILIINRIVDWNSKLCRWGTGAARESMAQTFYNQALNTLWQYGSRALSLSESAAKIDIPWQIMKTNAIVYLTDARKVAYKCDLWITDPPYADAVNYHELTEYFLAWDKALLQKAFPDWYADSKRVLAVRGDEHFSDTMTEIYRNLAKHMPDDGMQIVMFTHSDSSVWAQLALIMWKAGLRVCAAWNIATETDASGLKDGNYIKGTVLLVLRKQTSDETAFLDEIDLDIKDSVAEQIESMRELDEHDEPNFSDPDYVLAAYAASLKVLTSYRSIEDINLDKELDLAINDPSRSEVVRIIEKAKRTAYDCIIPQNFDSFLWRDLSPAERFYIKGLEYEFSGGNQVSAYQEYARGFALHNYSSLMASERANTARLKTPSEFMLRSVPDIPDFESSVLRKVLSGIYIAEKEESAEKGLAQIKNELPGYWQKRDMVRELLRFVKSAAQIDGLDHWKSPAAIAEILLIMVENDHI